VLYGQALEDFTHAPQVAQGVVDAARDPLGVGELLEDVGPLRAKRLEIGVFSLESLQDRSRLAGLAVWSRSACSRSTKLSPLMGHVARRTRHAPAYEHCSGMLAAPCPNCLDEPRSCVS
jgi:hypothetical protein